MQPDRDGLGLRHLEGWQQGDRDTVIYRWYELPNWREALEFAEYALHTGDKLARRPVVEIDGGRVRLSFTGGPEGLDRVDFAVAREIDRGEERDKESNDQ